MHASIWKFTGDAAELAHSYDALAAEMPTAEFIAHLCLLTPDGILIVDTCPTQEAFEAFAGSGEFRSALPGPTRTHRSARLPGSRRVRQRRRGGHSRHLRAGGG